MPDPRDIHDPGCNCPECRKTPDESRVDTVTTDILKQADELIHGERARAYGSALENAETWATLFTAATGIEVRAEHYPVSQICVKLARERSRPHPTDDNWRDIAGYVGVHDKIVKERRRRNNQQAEEMHRGIVMPVDRDEIRAAGGLKRA